MRVADAILELLIAHEVEVVFGVPGDTSMSFHNAFQKYQDKVKYVSCRDERHAAYMADTYARVSGKPGVVDVPSGGGLLYAIPGLSEATSSSIPIICFSSDISQLSQETGALTELRQQEVSNAVTKWNVTVNRAEHVPHRIKKAFRIALGGRPGAVHISVPEDVHETIYPFSEDDLTVSNLNRHVNSPAKADVQKVIQLLKSSERPVVLAGGGVHLSQAYQEITKLADDFNIPVATSINGKGSIAETNDRAVGVIGVNGGNDKTNSVIQESDLVIVLGSKLNNVTTVAKTIFKNNPKIVQVDISEEILELNVKPDVSIQCDIKQFLTELIVAIEKTEFFDKLRYNKWNQTVQNKVNEKFIEVAKEVNTETDSVNPARIIDLLDKMTDESALFVIDAGTQNPYMAANFKTKKAGRTAVFDRGHGNLGYALSASFGAKFASKNSQVFSMFGDGSFAMSVGELETAARLDLPIVFMLFQNNSYGWIKKLHQLYFDEEYIGVDFTQINGAKIAEGFGIKSKIIETNDELEAGIKWALGQSGPVFLDLRIEPITDIVPPVTNWREDSQKSPDEREALTY